MAHRSDARERALSGGTASGVRGPIRASWSRARRHGLAPDAYLPPVCLDDDELARHREEHALTGIWPLLRRSLGGLTEDPGRLLFLSDARGHLLWVQGDHTSLRSAERVHLLPGALWSEDAAGTSGVGSALATGRPFQVFGAEHFLSAATAYTCTATPIHDPISGDLLGILDFTCPERHWQPLAIPLLDTARRLAQSELETVRLREEMRVRTRYVERIARRLGTRSAIVDAGGRVVRADPPGWLPNRLPIPVGEGPMLLPGGQLVLVERLAAGGLFLLIAEDGASGPVTAAPMRLEALGLRRARLHVAGATHELTRRHAEIVTTLLSEPGGMTAKAITEAVYGPTGRPATVRAELARLRAILGHRLASDPYRLTGDCEADFLDLDHALSNRDTTADTLLDRYRGPLLPGSTAPRVLELRAALHERLRNRVVETADADTAMRWAGTAAG
ncbi:GAF domain-containing protein [Embleya sp. NPDC059237]|uniref:GAF domain-containing protein n=1 Tax=Embleya sp. NPDC059237 TaxID=3346784 RepID=UPI0036A92E3E